VRNISAGSLQRRRAQPAHVRPRRPERLWQRRRHDARLAAADPGAGDAAPGTIYVETAAGPCRLFPFEFSPTQGYVIEASAGKFRFYTNDARIETAPGVAYEVAHPYTLAELKQLSYWQSNDELFLAGANKARPSSAGPARRPSAFATLTLREGPDRRGQRRRNVDRHRLRDDRRGDDHVQRGDLRGDRRRRPVRDHRQGLQRRPELGTGDEGHRRRRSGASGAGASMRCCRRSRLHRRQSARA
jgi:hypothetical protein